MVKSRQKKRIKDTAKMVKNVRDMSRSMENILNEYEGDLKSFLSALIKKQNQKNDSTTSDVTTDALILHPFSKIEDDEEATETDPDSEETSEAKKKEKTAPQIF